MLLEKLPSGNKSCRRQQEAKYRKKSCRENNCCRFSVPEDLFQEAIIPKQLEAKPSSITHNSRFILQHITESY